MKRILSLVIVIFLIGSSTQAQDSLSVDSIAVSANRNNIQGASHHIVKDSVFTSQIDSFQWERIHRKNPKRAGLYAALFPGAGQVYNRQYWKLPIVYGLVGVGTGVLINNLNNYNETRKEVAARMSLSGQLNPDFQFLTTNQLLQQQSIYRENVDLTILLIGLGYILQIMDAVAANHLKDFDISPDISMRFKISPLPYNQVGVGLAFNFK